MDADGRWRVLRLHVEDQVPLAALARSTGVGERTLQRWHQRYRAGGIAALEPRPRADAGQRRTSADVVLFVERLALTRPRPSIATLYRLTVAEADQQHLPAPSYSTVRAIVQALDPALVTLALMTTIWLASVRLRNASIVDIFWGFGFVVAGWVYLAVAQTATVRGWLIVALVTLWGLRLSIHLFRRNAGKGEDYRYREMRERRGPGFWWYSYFSVYLLQGVILWIVAHPLWVATRSATPASLTWLDWLGAIVFLAGLLFEAVGDWQLARFKSDPANRGKLLTEGLWRYTRHPNYFGDAVVWWGLSLIALATPGSTWVLISPVLMTFLLVRVSGVSLLEQRLRETKPGFADYVDRTSSFVPWIPRRSVQP